MVLLTSSMNSFWVDRSLVDFQIELKQLAERDSLVLFQQSWSE